MNIEIFDIDIDLDLILLKELDGGFLRR